MSVHVMWVQSNRFHNRHQSNRIWMPKKYHRHRSKMDHLFHLMMRASRNVLDNQLGGKVQEEPAAVSDRAPHSDVQDAETKTFCGRSLDEVMVLEIFAGTARLTRAIRDIGMAAMAVDKDSTRAQSVHVACYDLNDPDQLQALCDFILKHHHQILWAHFAPSCGTASRARGRPLPKLAKMGIKVPQPLRSDKQPLGLDGLAGTDKIRPRLQT